MRASRRVFRRLQASSIIRAFREDAVIRIISFFGALALAIVSATAFAQDKPEASNMRLVGYNDLQGRSAYQPWIHHQGDRWIAYIGHHGGIPENQQPINALTGQAEFNGTSLVDVTDPAHPKYLAHIPGEQGTYEAGGYGRGIRSEEHTSELQSRQYLVCRLLLEKKKHKNI